MKERCEKTLALGLIKNPEKIVKEIEDCAIAMKNKGWYFITSNTDSSLNEVKLLFEREIEV